MGACTITKLASLHFFTTISTLRSQEQEVQLIPKADPVGQAENHSSPSHSYQELIVNVTVDRNLSNCWLLSERRLTIIKLVRNIVHDNFQINIQQEVGAVNSCHRVRSIRPPTRLKSLRSGRLLRYTVVVDPVQCRRTRVASLSWDCSHFDSGVRII